MKKLLMALGMAALLAGCAAQDRDNGMGGTSDQSSQDTMKTDSIHSTQNGGSLNSNSDSTGAPSNPGMDDTTSTPATTPQPQ